MNLNYRSVATIYYANHLLDELLLLLGVACRACWHACPFPDEAIRVDELGHPIVIEDGCVGCGLCEHACLTETPAIRVVTASDEDPAGEAEGA